MDSQFVHANYTPGCNIHTGLTKSFQRINTSCFSQPDLGVYGNLGRNSFHNPGINNWDMGIGKEFTIVERLRFLFKMDTFNTFNHHQYGGDVGGLIVAGSGGGSSIDNRFDQCNLRSADWCLGLAHPAIQRQAHLLI